MKKIVSLVTLIPLLLTACVVPEDKQENKHPLEKVDLVLEVMEGLKNNLGLEFGEIEEDVIFTAGAGRRSVDVAPFVGFPPEHGFLGVRATDRNDPYTGIYRGYGKNVTIQLCSKLDIDS